MRIVRFPVLPARRCARAASRAWASVFTGPAGETTIVCAASVQAKSRRQALMPIRLTRRGDTVSSLGAAGVVPAGSACLLVWNLDPALGGGPEDRVIDSGGRKQRRQHYHAGN